MQAKEKEVIQSYRRVFAFLDEHPVPPPATYAEPREMLDQVLANLGDHSTAQDFGRRVSKAEKRRQYRLAARLRRHHLYPISTIATAELRGIPGITEALRMPASHLGVEKLLAAAKAMREAADRYRPVFVKNGRAPDFLEQLAEATRELEATIGGHAKVVGTQVGARAGIAQEIRRGRLAVKMLDAIVRSAFEGNDVVLARWRTARRVKQLPSNGGGPEPVDISPAPVSQPEKAA